MATLVSFLRIGILDISENSENRGTGGLLRDPDPADIVHPSVTTADYSWPAEKHWCFIWKCCKFNTFRQISPVLP